MIYAFMCLIGLGIVYSILKIQLVEGDRWRGRAETLTTEYRHIEAVRGIFTLLMVAFLLHQYPAMKSDLIHRLTTCQMRCSMEI